MAHVGTLDTLPGAISGDVKSEVRLPASKSRVIQAEKEARETDITYSGFELRDGPVARIDVLVSPKAAMVSGVAQSRDTGKPAAGATVLLVPKEKERVPISEYYQQATTDQFGRFAFKSVVPGEYKVYAWEDVESTAWMDPEFMKPLEGKGESVTVGESAQASVQVNLIPAESEKDKAKSTTGRAQL